MDDHRLPDLTRSVAGISAPDSRIAKEAVELAWEVSSPALFNHVMRSYYFGQLVAGRHEGSQDKEVVFLSTTLHDLGLTRHARGPRRFEIEGADAARRFLLEKHFDEGRTWLVWDTIALHTWHDLNLSKEPEARIAQLGIAADVVGAGLANVEPALIAEILRAFPRHRFNETFVGLLLEEARSKPDVHIVHPAHMIAHHCCGGVPIPDARAMVDASPFEE